MKLEKVLDQLNSFEKNSFLKVLENLASNKNSKEIDKILSASDHDIKSIDNRNVSTVFKLVNDEFSVYVNNLLMDFTNQLDILIDILIRDGNSIMSREWLDKLYEIEFKDFKKKLKEFKSNIENEELVENDPRLRDYVIYKNCLNTAYNNDLENNQESKITWQEQMILNTLSEDLELSQEEIKMINYLIMPLKRAEIDQIITDLKNIGVILYSKKNHTIYIPDEMVIVLRKIRGKEVADKYFRRVLRTLKDSQLNFICRKHNIDWKVDREIKIKKIIKEGVSFRKVLKQDIFKAETNITERKAFLNDMIEKSLRISTTQKGVTIDDKIDILVDHFEEIDSDEKISITNDGYDKLLMEIKEDLPKTNELVKTEFELQEENVLNSDYLLDYNIKPRDILEIIDEEKLKGFCEGRSIKSRGDIIQNILSSYKDAENLFIQNFVNIGFRNLNELKENGIQIKESDIGVKFEDVAKTIFNKLGFDVDEKLRKKINTSKNKIDILINLEDEGVIIIECKSVKESGYNKFSSVSRQIKAYRELVESKDLKVTKCLLIAPEFNDDFISECELDLELDLSLITAEALVNILNAFKQSKHKEFPYKLLMRDVLIKDDRIVKAISK